MNNEEFVKQANKILGKRNDEIIQELSERQEAHDKNDGSCPCLVCTHFEQVRKEHEALKGVK